jgi:putative endonuclease
VPDRRNALGAAGETAVATWYEAAGYAVLDRNWRCRGGELDLVLGRGRTIVFCEVKTRRSDAFGIPAEAVTPRKQQRVRGLAVAWLAERGVRGDVRFDVASVRPASRGGLAVEVLEAAF